MLSSKYWITNCILLTLLVFSAFTPTLVYAAPLANSDKDWQYTNGNSWGWNYSPQNQINTGNVGQLEVKWVFPLGGNVQASATVKALTSKEGSTTPPIVVNGLVYLTTNYLRTYAVNASTGKQVWVNDYLINATDLQSKLPLVIGGGLQQHLHGIRYWEAGNALLLSGWGCDIYGVDAKTGKSSFWIQDLCKDIPGNLYKYRAGSVSQTNIGTYEKGKQFIFVLPGVQHSGASTPGDFRHTTLGVDMNTKQILWRVFSFPPQDIPTKDWALQECNIGYFRDISCSEVAAKAPENLEWDWAQPGQPPSQWGGVTANWGQIVVDEDTGIAYTQTGNQGPYSWLGDTPGPRLYGSTIMAIDLSTGKRIWWQQPMPRDPYDYDCNWGGILADVPNLGKVYMKGCKEGLLNILDAKTGKPINIIDVVDDEITWGQITAAAAKEGYQGGVKYHLNDPFSNYDMRVMNSPDNSNYCGRPCSVFPAWGNGLFATDMTYDPETGTLYHYAGGLQTTILQTRAPAAGVTSFMQTQGGFPSNTTIVARDVATGKVKWTWFYPLSLQRSAMVVTPELLFTGFKEGYMRFFDKTSGKVLNEINLGSDMMVELTTGLDSTGKQKIFTVLGVGSGISPRTPGILVAIGLSDKAAAAATQTTTVTTTQATTVTTTSVSTSVTTSVSTSATTQTLTTTTATTVTTTQAPKTQTTTVTSNAPTQTVTTTKEVTTGLPTEVTYAAVGVAVIALIAAAVLVMRKK